MSKSMQILHSMTLLVFNEVQVVSTNFCSQLWSLINDVERIQHQPTVHSDEPTLVGKNGNVSNQTMHTAGITVLKNASELTGYPSDRVGIRPVKNFTNTI